MHRGLPWYEGESGSSTRISQGEANPNAGHSGSGTVSSSRSNSPSCCTHTNNSNECFYGMLWECKLAKKITIKTY